jgi:hypothetical protein
MRRYALAALMAVLAALSCGCSSSLKATVADSVNEQIPLTEVRLGSGKLLKVSQGGAVKLIQLKDLRRITIHPYETVTLNRELYFLADIEMRDGTVLASERAGWNVTFVCVNDVINGNADKDETVVRIPLDKVSRITFK